MKALVVNCSDGADQREELSVAVGDNSCIQFWLNVWLGVAHLNSCFPRILLLERVQSGLGIVDLRSRWLICKDISSMN